MVLINKRKANRESGQALLLILLAMAAILTIVLSVASRSVTDVSITADEENALRAFSAAEAGIEKALLTGQEYGTPQTVDPGSTFTSDIITETPGDEFVYPGAPKAGESATFWFVEHDPATGNLTCSGGSCTTKNKMKLCFGYYPASANYASSADRPAVLMSVYYDWTGSAKGNLTSPSQDYQYLKVARLGFDSNSGRTSQNNFGAASVSGTNDCKFGGKHFGFYVDNIHFSSGSNSFNIPNGCRTTAGCLVLLKVRFFYNNNPEQVGVDFQGAPGSGIPPQGNRIESTGVASESIRQVNVFQTWSEPPAIFDSAVLSLTDFDKI